MIYVDSSVALAQLFAEDRSPPNDFDQELLISSRLLEYEVWTRIHARGFTRTHIEEVRELIQRIELIELTPTVLARALEPLPVSVRTLDALHLATIEFLREGGQAIELASYDGRLVAAARALGISIYKL